jgi:hypothetical protein
MQKENSEDEGVSQIKLNVKVLIVRDIAIKIRLPYTSSLSSITSSLIVIFDVFGCSLSS